MRVVYLEKNPTKSKFFPIQLRTNGFVDVFPNTKEARNAAIGRFGNCKIIDKTTI